MAPIRFSTIFITSVLVILWGLSINGDNAEAGSYPYLVAIKYSATNTYRCPGHIISPSWILTRAECVSNYDETQLHIQYGITKLSLFRNVVNISEVIPHPNYNSKTSENDIGLIKLQNNLEFNQLIQPTKLPPKNYIPSVGSISKSVGWYSDANKNVILDLQVFNSTIMSNIDCSEIRNEKVKFAEICTQHPLGSADCTLGGGSGLVLDNYLYGIDIKGSSSCKATKDPSVYIRVNSYYSWIFGNIVKYELENILKPVEWKTPEILRSLFSKLQFQLPEVN